MEISFPFNSVNGDRPYNAEHWRLYFLRLFRNGIVSGDLQVMAGGGMTVRVSPGFAWIEGAIYRHDETAGFPLDIPTASGNLNRVDAVVLRLDLSRREIRLDVIQGNASPVPDRPLPTRNTVVTELVLAYISINAGTINITQSMITDTRMDRGICGWVTGAIDQIDFSQITAQFDDFFVLYRGLVEERYAAYNAILAANENSAGASLGQFVESLSGKEAGFELEFRTWFDALRGLLGDDPATELAEEIILLKGRIEELEEFVAGLPNRTLRAWLGNSWLGNAYLSTASQKGGF